jgi:hypothetical protein
MLVGRHILSALLDEGTRVRLRVHGPSMAPAIHSGDAVVIEALGSRPLEPGELAVYRGGDRLYAHRFSRWLQVDGAQVMQFVADAKVEPDPPVAPESVIGRIVRVEPGLSRRLRSAWQRTPALVRAPLLRLHAHWAQLVGSLP